MKIISMLIIVLYINACGGAKKATENIAKETAETETNIKQEAAKNKGVTLEYIEQTRGVYRMVKITSEMVSSKFKHDGKVETKPCSNELWRALMDEMQTINLKEVPALEAPSTTHRRDVKPMANLTIIEKGETYSTVTFDAGNPHEKLASLINTMLTAIDNKN